MTGNDKIRMTIEALKGDLQSILFKYQKAKRKPTTALLLLQNALVAMQALGTHKSVCPQCGKPGQQCTAEQTVIIEDKITDLLITNFCCTDCSRLWANTRTVKEAYEAAKSRVSSKPEI